MFCEKWEIERFMSIIYKNMALYLPNYTEISVLLLSLVALLHNVLPSFQPTSKKEGRAGNAWKLHSC